MFWRMVRGALFRQKGKMLMIAFTIALGTSLATAMINVMLDVGDKVNQELKTYGANIRVMPKEASLLGDFYGVENETGRYLKEEELPKIKTIFWTYNIVDFSPYLLGKVDTSLQKDSKLVGAWYHYHLALPTGETVDTGIKSMKTWWDLEGEWLLDHEHNKVMVGRSYAKEHKLKLGDQITLKLPNQTRLLTVKAIFDAGGAEDEELYVTLKTAQEILDKEGFISSVEVSALTTPDNELARRAAKNPQSLSMKEMETWYCTAYVSSISYQIQEVFSNSVVKPIRQVAESEGAILEKTQLLMLLITILTLVGSALGISNLVTASVMERSKEIGLLKAIGAHNTPILLLVLTEIIITGIFGVVIGYFAGFGFAQIIGHTVFNSAIEMKTMVIPLVSFLILLVIIAGSVPSIRLLLSLRPAEVLHGR